MQSEDKIDILSTAMRQILQWCMAFPIEYFPEPDMKLVRELLSAGGVSLGAVTASSQRICLEGVGSIAMAALECVKD